MPGVIDLVKESWTYFKGRLKPLFILNFLPTFTAFFVGIVTVIIMMVFLSPFYTSPSDTRAVTNSFSALNLLPILIVPALLLGIAIVLFLSLSQLALLYAIVSPDRPSIKDSYSKAWRHLWSFWGLAFLTGFIVSGAYFLFLIPGLIFGIWFSFANYAFTADNLTGFTALTHSRALVRGRFWVVTSRLVLGGILILLPQILLSAIIPVIGQLISGIISLFTTPLITCFAFILYRHLKQLNPNAGTVPSSRFKTITIATAIIGTFFIPLVILLLVIINPTSKIREARDQQSRSDIITTQNALQED